MTRILYITASPRGERSRSQTVARAFLEACTERDPGAEVVTLDLFAADLPPFDAEAVRGKFAAMAGEEPPTGRWDEVVAVNLKSVFLVTQAVLPAMRAAKWGRIVNLSSVAAQTGGVVGPHYAASKAGIVGLTHSYAALLAKEGIAVNAIAPALIETEMVRGNPRARSELIPVGRFGMVEEVADVAVMLAANGYVTGQTINVNGGWYMS